VTGAPKLVVDGVGKAFSTRTGDLRALKGIDLSVFPGEFVTLVGPSGSGKTTLLNIIAGLEEPDEGRVLVDSRPVRGPGPDRVVMFQEAALFPWLTVRANVEFGLAMRGTPRRERRERSTAYLRMVRLDAFAEARVHELSGGMRQRVALVRALVLDPDVLLMDEPFASLDAESRDALAHELEHLWDQLHMTVVFVSHHVHEGVRLADRVIAFGQRPGRILAEYPVDRPRPRGADDEALAALARTIEARFTADVRAEQASEPARAQ